MGNKKDNIDLEATAFRDRVRIIAEETIESFLFSKINALFAVCIVATCTYIIKTSSDTLSSLDQSVRSLENSLVLLNSSLSVIDERTRRNEEELIELEKQL